MVGEGGGGCFQYIKIGLWHWNWSSSENSEVVWFVYFILGIFGFWTLELSDGHRNRLWFYWGTQICFKPEEYLSIILRSFPVPDMLVFWLCWVNILQLFIVRKNWIKGVQTKLSSELCQIFALHPFHITSEFYRLDCEQFHTDSLQQQKHKFIFLLEHTSAIHTYKLALLYEQSEQSSHQHRSRTEWMWRWLMLREGPGDP